LRPLEHVVFGHTVEALLKVLRARQDEGPLRQRLKAVGVDLDLPLEPAYPYAQWQQLLRLASEELFPGLPAAEAHWRLGERFIQSYFETNMGRALQGVLKLLGPARTLERTTRNMASGNNYLQFNVERLSPTDYRLRVNQGGLHPEFIGALCHFGTLTTGVKNLSTVMEGRAGSAATYRMRW
jgi:uncharacterized protein (TIGR02265 family)